MKNVFKVMFLLYLVSSCSATINDTSNDYKDKCSALNEFLKTENKDPTKGVIVLKEKYNSNRTIEKFKGDSVVYTPTNIIREGGVSLSLYRVKDWVKMKKKYYNKNTDVGLLKNDFWKETDFTSNNILLLNYQQLIDYSNGKEIKGIDISRKEVYTFSNLIYYRNKKTIVFYVSVCEANCFEGRGFLIIMKKKNEKWIEIERVFDHY